MKDNISILIHRNTDPDSTEFNCPLILELKKTNKRGGIKRILTGIDYGDITIKMLNKIKELNRMNFIYPYKEKSKLIKL